MAGRKNKYTVDYFPHYCSNESKSMFILENKFGLIGYAVWYKTLELLGKSTHHYLDLREETDLLFLISKLGITQEKFEEIYDLLAKLNTIDNELWNNKIVFSDNFVNNIEDAYVRRKGIDVLHKLDLCKHLSIKCEQKFPKKSKGKESKGKEDLTFDVFWNHYHKTTNKPKTDLRPSEKKWKKLNSKEKEKAFNFVEKYSKTNKPKYLKKARTYLEDKNFNDELEIEGSVLEKPIFKIES